LVAFGTAVPYPLLSPLLLYASINGNSRAKVQRDVTIKRGKTLNRTFIAVRAVTRRRYKYFTAPI
jgi:hypothetical protein